MLTLIEGINNQLKSLTTVIKDFCSSDDESVRSEKKAKILKIITSDEYQK